MTVKFHFHSLNVLTNFAADAMAQLHSQHMDHDGPNSFYGSLAALLPVQRLSLAPSLVPFFLTCFPCSKLGWADYGESILTERTFVADYSFGLSEFISQLGWLTMMRSEVVSVGHLWGQGNEVAFLLHVYSTWGSQQSTKQTQLSSQRF